MDHSEKTSINPQSTMPGEALCESQERLDLVLRQLTEGFWDWNIQTGELYLSPRCLDMLGYEAHELEPHIRSFEKLGHPEDLPRLKEVLPAHLECGDCPQLQIQHRVRDKSGAWKWILIRGIVGKRDEHGNALCMVGTATDITDRERAAEELRQHRHRFDAMVAQRTLELAQANARLQSDIAKRERAEGRLLEQAKSLKAANMELEAQRQYLRAQQEDLVSLNEELQEANELANAGNQAKSEFLANMSHEIRTPMNGIMGMTELALDSELTAEQREYMTIVLQCSESLLTLLNDILDFSKIEAGRLDIETIDFNLDAALEGVTDLLGHQAAKKGLEFICYADPNIPDCLRGDPGRLRQVLVNLAGNAIKFTERGEVVVSAELEKRTDEVVTLCFSVRDTGIGIPKERQETIFDSFSQADGTITRRYGGTGLGLTVSKQIVDLLGGEIWVDSEPGRGSDFSFRVTLGVGSNPEVSVACTPLPVADALHLLNGKRILLAQGNSTVNQVVSRMLESWGCLTEAAPEGDAALDMLRSSAAQGLPFDLMILDIQTPQTDAPQFGHTVKSDPSFGDPELLFLASPSHKDKRTDREGSPCASYLTKPVKQSVLASTLVEIFGRSVSPTASHQPRQHPTVERRRYRARILLVEDNQVNRLVADTILRKYNCDVTTAENGRQALDVLNRRSFDLVFMDVQMPVLDGFEATQQIRDDGRWGGLPVIAMTAHAMKGDRERCLQVGMNDYLSKPVTVEALRRMVRKWVPVSGAPSKAIASSRHDPLPGTDCGSQPPAPVDLHKALRQLGGDQDLLADALDALVAELPQLVDELRGAADSSDSTRLRAVAHGLKGAASNICAEPLRSVSEQLEQLAECGDLRRAGSLLSELQAHTERLLEFVASSNDAPGTSSPT